VKTDETWQVQRQLWCHFIPLDPLLLETQIMTPKKQTGVWLEDAHENTAFILGFEIYDF
jgi:hypothetical protein